MKKSKNLTRIRWSRIALIIPVCTLAIVLFTIFLIVIRLNDSDYIAQTLPPKPVDTTPPTIILNGTEETYVTLGTTFNDLGVTAYDDRSETTVAVSGEVDTGVEGEYILTYTAADNKGNISTANRKIKVIPLRGKVYLTFDDGPGDYTGELLNTLAKYGVKATFFVTGSGDDDLIKREYDEGHTIGLHTSSHNYSYIYQNIDNFFEDLIRVQDRVKNITGYTSYLMRFPGGSSNTVSARYDGGSHIMSKLVEEVGARGFTYFDWNITSGDAGQTTDTDVIYENVISRLGDGGEYIVLQHDVKDYSVQAVESIIKYGLENGYVFDKLSASSFAAHHGVNN